MLAMYGIISLSMSKEWWQDNTVEEHMHSLQSYADKNRTLEEVNFIEHHLVDCENINILDLACGNGRHSSELSQRGYKVYGLDYAYGILKVAKGQKGMTQFVNSNMLSLPFRNGSFGAVLSMWQSLGYFGSEDDNQAVFSETSRALVKNGVFIIQVNNPLFTVNNLYQRGAVVDEKGRLVLKEDIVDGENVIAKTVTFDPYTFRYESRRRFIHEPEENSVVHDMRYFSFPELRRNLVINGFEVINACGSVRGEPYKFSSEQIIIVAKKVT